MGCKKSNPVWKEFYMKKMNLSGLSTWQPRRPAAGLKRRIFASQPITPEHKSFWNLLVPAAACMVLSMFALNPGNTLAPLSHHLMGSLTLSNLSYSAFNSGDSQNAQNHLASLTFEWTNRSGLSSPIGFTSSTN